MRHKFADIIPKLTASFVFLAEMMPPASFPWLSRNTIEAQIIIMVITFSEMFAIPVNEIKLDISRNIHNISGKIIISPEFTLISEIFEIPFMQNTAADKSSNTR